MKKPITKTTKPQPKTTPTKPVPVAAKPVSKIFTAVLRDGDKREVRLLTDSDDTALLCARLAFPDGEWRIADKIMSADPDNAVIDATSITLDSETIDRVRKQPTKVAPQPKPVVKAEPKPNPVAKPAAPKRDNSPKAILARVATTKTVGLKEFGYRAKFPMPKGLKLPDGVEWPGAADSEGIEIPGDALIWQMLAAQRYTPEQIVKTAMEHFSWCYEVNETALATIPVVKSWMNALGYKGTVVM